MPEGFREQVAGFGSKASEWLFYALAFIFPFFVLPLTVFPSSLNKSYLVYFGILIIGIIYLITSLQSGKIKIPKSLMGIFLLVFIASVAVSGLLSKSPHVSFSGLGSEPGTLSAIGIFALTLIFAFLVMDSEEKTFRTMLAFFGSFLVLVVFQIFQTLLKIPLWPSMGVETTANLLGSWNELGIFSGLIVLLSSIFLEFLPKSYLKMALWVILIASLVLTALVNLSLVWWTLAGILVILLAYHYSQGRGTSNIFRVTFVVLLVSLVMLFSGKLITDIGDQLKIQFIEVRPNLEFTLKTASGALSENAAFGYGPNAFAYSWAKHRPLEILSTPFWQARFNAGYGFVPTLLVTTGLVGALSLLVFLAFLLYYGFKGLVKSTPSSSFLILATFGGALYMWVFAFLYSGGFALIFPTFLLTGLFFGLAMQKGIMEEFEISLFERSIAGFVGALLIILLIVLGASWVSILAQKYYASILYGDGSVYANAGNLDSAGDAFTRAIKFDKRDIYLRSYTDLGLLKLQRVVNSSATDDEKRTQFQSVLADTIDKAQEASNINPIDSLNWMNLGKVYEAVIPFQIQGVVELAQSSYAKASEVAPTSPEAYLASARVEILKNDLPKAKDFLDKAIGIKKDYAEAHFLLAQIEATRGNIAGAIKSAENTAYLAPNDVGVLFQLGLLYYQNNQIAESQIVLERAVSIIPSYSNARYFLGLAYARQGNRDKALEQFRNIEVLNPTNAEVKKIIANLSAGKDPLFEIAPPAPEKRPSVPVNQ
ncbi:hypothetical protein A3C75_00965 [Candidatus Giovannonibacteria bacterium RIFCSPHIGHO2_02_FULL_44_31]|uniref:Tetratricopeptide repeat protein 21A/21B second ARM domain-containing protein n=1 Tax=Candidatus Giovannonibacteria bacterium RIFCSPLOWO2_12_FULL_44_15 TaxID=1798364 RepID=A0A1F5Y017_9BACT|nr:MAG: hypothetical protein A3C75_00965 [Candidatus Giovannonibacteria bacterium RIFCSPHIGHO2_02_FULL_44_31]OGF93524.1 MAG: hypothetical protein A3G54_01090 [Candidatus Giovannonibacteria bacterium RIFCSPLOWO2_12_FULL_44_15]